MFEREERYIVIKLKDLATAWKEKKVYEIDMEGLDYIVDALPKRKYVVVESDWPEYETVWKMIEERVNATPSPA